MRGIVVIITFSILVFSLTSFAFAEQVSLSISPPLLEVLIKPGKSVLIAYSLANLSDPTALQVRVLPFSPKDEFGRIDVKEEFEGPVRFSLDNADIVLDQPFFLKAKDSKQVLLRIRVPEGAPEGDYYYTLIVETSPPPGEEGTVSSQAQARIGSNILITVTESDQVDIKGKIAVFDVLPHLKLGNLKIFDTQDKIPVVLVLQNNGKNLIKPEGEIILRGNFGEKATYSILPQNILADSQRQLVATPTAQVDCEKDRKMSYCKRPASLLISGFFIGNYKLSTSINFGEGSPNFFASTSFIALPLKFLLGLAGVLIISLILIKRFGK